MAALRESVVEFLDEVAGAWKRNDGVAVGDLFTEDGTLINPFGERADGRAAVTAMYNDYFAGMLGGTSTGFSDAMARPVGDDHAFLDCTQEITGGPFVMHGHLSALLRREGGQWRFVDVRPHSYSDPPA